MVFAGQRFAPRPILKRVGIIGGSREDPERTILRQEQSAWARLLGQGEQVTTVHRMGRSTFVFTTRRLIIAEEGRTGRQWEYLSLLYRSISSFSVEATGAFGLEADLKIWVTGRAGPVERQFASDSDVYAVQALLTQHAAHVAG